MLVFAPIAAFALLVHLLHRRRFEWRWAFLLATVAWALLLTVVTEFLSLFTLLDRLPLAIAWLGIAASLGAAAFVLPKRGTSVALLQDGERLRQRSWLLVPVVLILAVVGGLALTAAPSNFDSMTYHMARVAHWAQNRSNAHYPTHILRQLYQNPWAEFAIANAQILSGGDRFANLVQWFALAGCCVGISLVARQLGAQRRGQVLAVTICCTIPMAVLQASTTQNDLVLAFWMVCLTACGLALEDEGGTRRTIFIVAAGGSLGLAILTKATAYLLAAPLCLWFAISEFRRRRWRAAPGMAAVAAIALAVNLGHYARNQRVFGSPLGLMHERGGGEPKYTNDDLLPGAWISNILRNVALQLAVPSESISGAVDSAVREIHRLMGMDVNDPRTTFTGARFTVSGRMWNSEDRAPNLAHLLLAVAAGVVVLRSRWRDKRRLAVYLACLLAGFALFCWLIRWQQWHCRLHLPLLVLASAATAVVLERWAARRLAAGVAVFLLVLSVPFVVDHKLHPMFGPSSVFTADRAAQYFVVVPQAQSGYVQMAEAAGRAGARNVGLELGRDDPEYPFWVLLRRREPAVRIEHVNVTNASASCVAGDGAGEFRPDVIITIDRASGRAGIRPGGG